MPQIAVYIRKNNFEVLQKLQKKTGKSQTDILNEALIDYAEKEGTK